MAVGIGGLIEVAAEINGVGIFSGLKGLFYDKHSLINILKEEDGHFGYRGFPARLDDAQFKEMGLILKGTPEEAVILYDSHFTEVRQNVQGIIDFLVKEHGFDSIGLEGFYGPPRNTLGEDVRRDFNEFFEGKNIIKDKTATVHDESGVHYKKIPIIEPMPAGHYKKYVGQSSVPTFGIEDKDIYLRTIALMGLTTCMQYVNQHMNRQVRFVGVVRMPYDDVPNVDQLEDYVSFLKKKMPDVPFPGENLEEMIENRNRLNVDYQKFQEYLFDLRSVQSNFAMSDNIQEYLRTTDSKKPIIVVGLLHGLSADQILDRVGRSGFRLGFSPVYSPLHELLPYSTLSVDSSMGK